MCRLTPPLYPAPDAAIDDLLQSTTTDPAQLDDPAEPIPKDSPVGDPIELIKDPSWTRFYFQNPDGVTVGNGGDLETVFEHALDTQCDHLVLPETKLDTAQRWVKSRVHNHCRRIFGVNQYRAVMASSAITYSTTRKPGGIMSVTFGMVEP